MPFDLKILSNKIVVENESAEICTKEEIREAINKFKGSTWDRLPDKYKVQINLTTGKVERQKDKCHLT